MFYDILKQVEKDFNERSQWESFLELIGYKDKIRDEWFEILKSELNSCFVVEDIVENWGYVTYGIFDYRWFINDFGPESLCLLYENYSLHLWANGELFDLAKISQLLQKKKYIPIVSSFDKIDEINDENNSYKIVERGNFIFGDTNDGKHDLDQLSWYARFKTKEFVSQIKEKINKFRKNEEVTNLLIEINKVCKL
jgi:hypothetical protein